MARQRLEELVLQLVADSKPLQRELGLLDAKGKKAGKGLARNFNVANAAANKLKGALLGVAAGYAGLAGVRALTAQTREAIDFADSIDKVSSKLGTTTDFIQEYRFAAEQSGVATNTADMAFQRFARRSAEAAKGTGEARDAIAELNISLRDADGRMRNTEDTFSDALAALSEIEDPAERLRLAFKLFDSEGVAVVNVAKNFGALREEARELGVVLDEDTIRRSVEAKDALAQLALKAKVELGPVFADLAQGPIQDMARFLAATAHAAGEAWARMRDFLDLPPTNIAEMRDRVAELDEHIRDLESKRNAAALNRIRFGDAVDQNDPFFIAIRGRIAAAEKLRAQIADQLAKLEQRTANPAAGLNVPGALGGSGGIETKSAEAAAERRRKAITDLGLEAEQMQRLVAARQHGVEVYDAMRQRIELENAARAAGIEIGTKEFGELANSFDQRERLKAQLAEIEEKSKDAFGGMAKAAEDFGGQAADSIAGMVVNMELSFDRLAKSIAQSLLSNELRALFGIGGATSIFSGGLGGVFGGGSGGGGGLINPGAPSVALNAGGGVQIPSVSGALIPKSNLRKAVGSAGMAVPPVTVRVENHGNVDVGVQERQGPQGEREIEIWLAEKQDASVRNGALDNAMRDRFGFRPKGF